MSEDLYTGNSVQVVPRLHLLPPQIQVKHIKPFIKWPGGKRQLLKTIDPMLPKVIDVYHEPFIGGGALFFHLRREKKIRESAHLSDVIRELITTYKIVQGQPQELMNLLDSPMFTNSKSNFLRIRALNPVELTPLEVAARMIFLNKRCYNGLYRVNKSGGFNAAYDPSSVKRRTHDPNAILATSVALQGVSLSISDFEDAVRRHVELSDGEQFVFFDPPHWARYVAYTRTRFEWHDHVRLLSLCKDLDSKDVKFMVSNSDHEDTWELFDEFNIERVGVNYVINTDGSGRSGKTELLITNY